MDKEKQLYYVNLNPISMDSISTMRVNDGQLIEYEIAATQAEKEELERLINEVHKHDVELSNLFTFKHFDELTADADKDEYQTGLNDVYDRLYQLGTEVTKQQIQEIHLQNEDDNEPGL
ncbi:hypothetical protein JCM19046_4834 [Bacillus sp. JCM 19046]|uniref:Trm5-related predicted tRNA methylase n=1 Tax=Shouchella xiaoxiensis TaxID=766895 RepID=A0ABS2T0P2_9BACI|nr:hypothetical protein [Shouchella xiaoxiensis]MBM7841357.1 Trm5-related predicted tRNA methylase [Shouchella xiaoxiensis]GAF15504.1 hypothetical protein JCM19045_4876 [Bacillus sp. JCM 19045]GAF20131.1 hypothetical protein JCM19046_4834 [Bacillus sp. JCM 19046]